jgi:hypothetical protein
MFMSFKSPLEISGLTKRGWSVQQKLSNSHASKKLRRLKLKTAVKIGASSPFMKQPERELVKRPL